jgi:hypothetical protein
MELAFVAKRAPTCRPVRARWRAHSKCGGRGEAGRLDQRQRDRGWGRSDAGLIAASSPSGAYPG